MSDIAASPDTHLEATAPRVQHSSRRSALATGTVALFGLSLVSGLYLYLLADLNWNVGQMVLAVHIGLGVLMIVMLAAWLRQHLTTSIKKARNRLFFWSAWLFLGLFTAILLTGLLQTLPFFLYLIDIVWFYKFETYDLIGTVHLILAFITLIGLGLHLGLPHWTQARETKQ
jgi:hypothetical protein